MAAAMGIVCVHHVAITNAVVCFPSTKLLLVAILKDILKRVFTSECSSSSLVAALWYLLPR